MQLDFVGCSNLREHPILSDFFCDLRSDQRWEMVQLNDPLHFDLGEYLGELEELLGVGLDKLGFLAKFDEDGLLEAAYPPKVFADAGQLVLKFGELELPLEAMFEVISEDKKNPVIVNDALQFQLTGTDAKGFLTESSVGDSNVVGFTISKQSTIGARLRLSIGVACEKGTTKLSLEDNLAYGAGNLDEMVKPVPRGGTPTEGSFLVSRGNKKLEDLAYPVLADPKTSKPVDAAIIGINPNEGEYGGFFLTLQDSLKRTWTLFSNTSINKQLNANGIMTKDEAQRLGISFVEVGSKVTVKKWELINSLPGEYFVRVKPEREYQPNKFTADCLIVKGDLNPKYELSPVTIAERLAQLPGNGATYTPQLKSAAVEAEVVH